MNIFPKDIWVLLINEYFDEVAAFNCLRVCKLFNRYVKPGIVIPKYLREKIYEDHREYIEDNERRMCKICQQVLDKESMLKRHIQKHTKNNKKGRIQKHKLPLSCNYCQVPYIKYFKKSRSSKDVWRNPGHEEICPMRTVTCTVGQLQGKGKYGFVICRCPKTSWYKNEMKTHGCIFECRECHEIIQLPVNSTNKNIMWHTQVCTEKMNMVAKYGHLKWNFTYLGEKQLICYHCHQEYYEKCTCLCEKCRKNLGAHLGSNGKWVCDECATCEKCNIKWEDLDWDHKVWNFNQPPYCRPCFDSLKN